MAELELEISAQPCAAPLSPATDVTRLALVRAAKVAKARRGGGLNLTPDELDDLLPETRGRHWKRTQRRYETPALNRPHDPANQEALRDCRHD